MFRDKPTAYDRLSDAIADIGEKIGHLETKVLERVNPTPSTAERLRRAAVRTLGGEPRSTYSRYVPDFLQGWSVPTLDDARSSFKSIGQRLPDVQSGFDDARSAALSHSREVRRQADRARSSIADLRLPSSIGRSLDSRRGFSSVGNRPNTTLLIAGGVILAAGAAIYVTKKIADHTEEPDYDVVRKDGDIEIRDYDAMVVAETVKSGYHEKARRAGFETLADYIFAHNRSGKKIAMTAPVLQQLSETEGQTKGWAVRFVMPKKYLKSALPEPASGDVVLKDVTSKRVVAIRFSGNFNATLASKKLMSLYNYIADENLQQKGDPEYAFYNPPWTPSFLKRNEILIEITR